MPTDRMQVAVKVRSALTGQKLAAGLFRRMKCGTIYTGVYVFFLVISPAL